MPIDPEFVGQRTRLWSDLMFRMASRKTFAQILATAEKELWLGFESAKVKRHPGSRGSSREEALRSFLESQLPDRFRVTTGEAVDSREKRTGQLDIVIYDKNRTVPLLQEDPGDVLPAESLLAVIEVKSTLTQDELNKCAIAAKAVSDLRPNGRNFLPPRQDGTDASDGDFRCQYSVIAYDTNLREKDWPEKEWERLVKSTKFAAVAPNRIDRVLVLSRGLIVPPSRTGRATKDGEGMLREWFMHLSNFLVREADRRPAFDFQRYVPKKAHDWKKLRDLST